jgi:hypothetical protein
MRYSYAAARKAWSSFEQCDAHVFTRLRWRQREAIRQEAQQIAWFDPKKDEISFYKLPLSPVCLPVWQPTPRRAEPNPKNYDFDLKDWRDQDRLLAYDFNSRHLLSVR